MVSFTSGWRLQRGAEPCGYPSSGKHNLTSSGTPFLSSRSWNKPSTGVCCIYPRTPLSLLFPCPSPFFSYSPNNSSFNVTCWLRVSIRLDPPINQSTDPRRRFPLLRFHEGLTRNTPVSHKGTGLSSRSRLSVHKRHPSGVRTCHSHPTPVLRVWHQWNDVHEGRVTRRNLTTRS